LIDVNNNVPPDEAVYHLKMPGVELLALKVMVPSPHLEFPVAVGAAGAIPAFTVASTGVRELVHEPLLNSA
jgi:hypothetical protein